MDNFRSVSAEIFGGNDFLDFLKWLIAAAIAPGEA
jgi:hypothetical protein